MKSTSLSLLSTLTLLGLASAKTDIGGCISSATTNQWHEASMIWWVPDTGEICEFLDCGGGRAPPKTTVPGCPQYTGTATYEPRYMDGYGPGAVATTNEATETASVTAIAEEAVVTDVDTAEGDDNENIHEETSSESVVSHGTLSSVTITKTSETVSSTITPIASLTSAAVTSTPSPSPSGAGNGTEPGTDAYTGDNGVGSLRFNAGLGAVGLLAALML
ncbi:hypothetical protein BJY04DRAFT_188363 [Aspergillus karnatakaensis]|uniref:putative cell surface protein n=1 Tax=Aspergillus karnatakaensis TaxID=1810916 RepID=UPI003CCD0144